AHLFFPRRHTKTRPPSSPASTFSSLPEIVSDQISGDGAWMNFRFSRAPPPGGPPTPTLAAGAAALRPLWQPPSVDHGALPAAALNCAKKGHKLNSRCLASKVYPHEIDIQETRTNHRKLDSQATLSHRARGCPAGGPCSEAWSLRASRRDNDSGLLPPRPAGLRGLRPAMAADRAIRGPPARSPGQERHSQRTSDPR